MSHRPAHYNPGKWLRECFPEQTKSVASILIWTVVFLLDVALIFFIMWQLDWILVMQTIKLTAMLIVAGAFLLFWAETAVYNRILSNYRKTLE